jgi:hypothetical protein
MDMDQFLNCLNWLTRVDPTVLSFCEEELHCVCNIYVGWYWLVKQKRVMNIVSNIKWWQPMR